MLESIGKNMCSDTLLKRKRIRRVILHRISKISSKIETVNQNKKQLLIRKESESSNDLSRQKRIESFDNADTGKVTYLVNTNEEKMVLLSNDVNFTFYGSGIMKVYFGSINILGSTLLSFDETNMTYQFDFSTLYPLFPMETVRNNNKYDSNRLEMLIETETILKKLAKENPELGNLNEKHYYTLLVFQNISNNFTIVENPEKIHNIIKDSNFITNNYGQYCDYPNLLEKNHSFFISGKRNSGKSAFTTFLLNKLFLSHIKGDRELYLLDCDSGQPLMTEPFCISLIKVNQPIFINYPSKYLGNNVTVLKHFVEENSQINFWQSYLFLINSIIGYYRLNLNYNKKNYIVVNTNGHTDGLGYTVNSRLSELIKANLIFFIKNQFSGRGEKARKLEGFYYERFPRNTITINNNFNLDEKRNTYLKTMNRMLSLYNNLIGSSFSIHKKDISFPSFNDIAHDKIYQFNNLLEIDFSKINFSFDSFQPKSELDILLAINLKLCVFLEMDKFSQNAKLNESGISFSDLRVLDKSMIVEKNFIAFGIVINVDIMRKKLIIISNKMKLYVSNNDKNKIILFRNTYIDNCLGRLNEVESDNLFEKMSKNVEFYGEDEKGIGCSNEICYYLRNMIK